MDKRTAQLIEVPKNLTITNDILCFLLEAKDGKKAFFRNKKLKHNHQEKLSRLSTKR